MTTPNGVLLKLAMVEIERIAGAKLNYEDCLNIATAVIKIVHEQNKTAALAAVATAASVLEDPDLNVPADLEKKAI